MAVIDAVEGLIGDSVSFHYDIFADVLYLRRADERDTLEVGQEDERGLVVLRAHDDLRVIGLTIVSFWKRYGQGEPSGRQLQELAATIDECTGPLRARLLAA